MPNISADAPARHKCETCRIWHDHGDPCEGEPLSDHTIQYEDPYQEATVTITTTSDEEAAYRKTVERSQALQQPLLPTPAALEHVLAVLGWQCAYDLRSQQTWLRQGRGQWAEATDRKIAAIRRDISDTFKTPTDKPLKYGRVLWEDCFNAILDDRETDFFRDWLESLPPWDGHCRIDGWLHSCFDIDPLDDLATWAARFLLLGAVSRAYEPGKKLDETPVLVGAQGIGKSTALRMLFPPSAWGSRWFADGLHLASDPKTRAEAMQGRVLVEASEMSGSTRADLEMLKAFLSRTDDGTVRLAYRRNPESSPRRAIICGTSNSSESLPNDSTGNRRFVVVELEGGNPTRVREYLTANRGQMWAEAIALYHQCAEARLPDHLKAAQAERNEAHRRTDELLEDVVSAWLDGHPHETFRLEAIAQGCGILSPMDGVAKLQARDRARLTAALYVNGSERISYREKGRKVRGWSNPRNPWNPAEPRFPLEGTHTQETL